MPIRITLVSLTCLACLVACGGDPPPPAAVPPPQTAVATGPAPLSPCDLLTPADVTRIIEEPVQAAEPGGYECSYRRAASGGLTTRAVRVRLEEGQGTPHELFDRYKAKMQAALGTYEPESALGIATVAAWDGDALIAAAPTGRTTSAFLTVQLEGVAADEERGYAESLASAALSRLRTLRP